MYKLKRAVGKKVYIIEDSEQSHFAFNGNSKNVKQNKLSEASCYSFYPAKNLGAYGDGGLITTDKKVLYISVFKTSKTIYSFELLIIGKITILLICAGREPLKE